MEAEANEAAAMIARTKRVCDRGGALYQSSRVGRAVPAQAKASANLILQPDVLPEALTPNGHGQGNTGTPSNADAFDNYDSS